MDFIKPGIVDWKRVKTVDKMSKMAAKRLQEVLGNCNYAVELGRKLNFSLVGIAGLISVYCQHYIAFSRQLFLHGLCCRFRHHGG